jgi:hypothetical protein
MSSRNSNFFLALELSDTLVETLVFIGTASFTFSDKTPFPTNTALGEGMSIIYEDSMTVIV